MPFRLFGRGSGRDDAARRAAGEPTASKGIRFDALTEEWHLTGVMELSGRISDALNRREAIPITEVAWAGLESDGGFEPVPGLKSVDPYDLIVVMAGADSRPVLDDQQREAYKLHKVPYDVALDCPPFRVVGTVHLFPGTEPPRLLERQTELFVPVTEAITFLDGRPLGEATDVALVNRSYLKGVEQIDRRTNASVRPLPGRPLGGTSYGG